MILAVEILCLLLAAWAAYKTLPRRKKLDAVNFFHRALQNISPDPPAEIADLPVKEDGETPGPLLNWDDLDVVLLKKQLSRRLSHLIVLGFASELSTEMAAWLNLPSAKDLWELKELAKITNKPSDRLFLVSHGQACQKLMVFLHENPGLRDHVFAVLLIDPDLEKEWMAAHFNHMEMDAEAHHAIPYIQIRFSPGAELAQPPVSTSGWRSIDVIDLGTYGPVLGQDVTRLIGACWTLLGKRES